MKIIYNAILILLLTSCGNAQNKQTSMPNVNVDIHKELPVDIVENMIPDWFLLADFPTYSEIFQLTDRQWRQRLSNSEFRILRNEGTEAPFVNEYHRNTEEGVYLCRGCLHPVFSSSTKFHSSSGWPSFFAPITLEHIGVKSDNSFWMERTEVHCARCKSHLGHVFDDGPQPTGLRYCLNSLALQFVDKSNYEQSKNESAGLK